MNACAGTFRNAGRLVLAAFPLALIALPLHAESRSLYEMSYTPGQDALSTLDAFSGADRLRPGFRNDMHRGREFNLDVRSTQMPSLVEPGSAEHALETSGGFIQRFGSSGFGYGVDFGLGLHSSGGGQIVDPDAGGIRSSFMVSDFSTGPTFESGNLRSRVRVGVRYPLLGDADAGSAFYGHRGDSARSAGYLSLDSRLRFSNQTEVSVSLFYDDYGASASRDWLSEGLDFQGGAGASESVVGFEMGLNF
ncbi:hypothetical protein [Thioalkalivibrio sp.]|uniref:hypothetical protein n=1 Tax=Thioalkalivibrio sp. TaxID=2093813 RepID=UPI0012D6DF8C|nr:hypothetical protein [Thioalkalivibrio sp.]TVP77809.1 MAG: hypothetical protein EA346_12285 [Thioalkalivibrio sp.]